MGIANKVQRFLDAHGVAYDVVPHPYTRSAYGSAIIAKVSPNDVAKGVLLADESDYLLAVLPASRKLDLHLLRTETERDLELADEDEVAEIFDDCAFGAVPAVGPAYELSTLVEKCLRGRTELYFEAGDHEELIHVKESDYEALLGKVRYLSFTQPLEVPEPHVRPIFQ